MQKSNKTIIFGILINDLQKVDQNFVENFLTKTNLDELFYI
jgi:hypothetical protein